MKTQELREKYGYDFVSPFSEGLAWIQKGGKEFHIHPDGSRAD